MKNIYLKPFFTFLFSGMLFFGGFAQGTYNHSNTTVTDTVGTLYDNGGPNDIYKDNTLETPFTIKPSNGKEATIHFTEFSIETSEAGVGAACPYDYLEIYDGETADPLTLVGRFCGTAPPEDFTSTSGAVTLLFFSDGATELDGYEMLWNTGGPFPSNGGPTYCSGSGLPCPQAPNRSIFNVNIKTINNPSACSATGYSDYTDSIAEVAPDENVDLTVTTSGFGNPFHYMAAWVDWNQNGSFEELEKTEMAGNGVAMADFIGTIVVPADVTPGLTRMRIRYTTDPALGNGTPCGTDTDGEVEDYGILVGTRMPCLSTTYPENMDSVICLSDSIIYWDSVPDATNYNFTLQYDNGGSWVSVVANENLADTFYIVTSGFLPGKHYQWIAVPNSSSNTAFSCDTLEFYTAAELNPILSSINREILVCPGEPGDLVGTITEGKPTITFDWFGEVGSLSRTDTAISTFTNNTPGLYAVQTLATDANGCKSDTAEYSIRVKPNPGFTSIDFGDTTLCFGEDALVAVSDLDGTISFEYNANSIWEATSSSDDGLGNYRFSLPLDTLQVRGIMDLNGCRDTTASQLFENPIPPTPPNIFVIGTAPFCDGDAVSLGTDPSDNIVWSDGETTAERAVTMSGNYFVSAIYPDGCTRSSEEVEITFIPPPATPDVSLVGVDSLTCSIAGTNYYWFKEGVAFGPNSRTIFVSEKGNYSVIVDNASGCVSEESLEFVYEGIGILEFSNADFSLFPNPIRAGEILQIDSQDEQLIVIHNQIGQQLKSVQLARGINAIQLNLKPGIYFLRGETQRLPPIRLILQ